MYTKQRAHCWSPTAQALEGWRPPRSAGQARGARPQGGTRAASATARACAHPLIRSRFTRYARWTFFSFQNSELCDKQNLWHEQERMTHFSLSKKPLQITLSFWLREILLFYNNYRVSSTVDNFQLQPRVLDIRHDGVVKRICIPRSRVASAVLRHQTTEAPRQEVRMQVEIPKPGEHPQAWDCCTLLSTISCH